MNFMTKFIISFSILLLAVSGCAGRRSHTFPPDHPANPAAPAPPMYPESDTLIRKQRTPQPVPPEMQGQKKGMMQEELHQ
jgi:hypothetical protein